LDPLGSNHPVTLSENGKCLLVVNAGSDTVTSFAIGCEDDLLDVQRVGEYSSGGMFPVSIATKDGLAYVLNSGGEGNLVSFTFDEERCTLREITGATHSLEFDHTNQPSLSVSPGSIKLTLDKQRIFLTINGFNQGLIIVYHLDEFGIQGRGTYTISSGFQPFSIVFDSNGNLLVVKENDAAPEPPAFAGPPARAGAVSLYRFTEFGTLEPLSRSIPNNQSAPCWSTIYENCLYTANVVSGSISSYTIDENGEIALSAQSEAAVPGAIDHMYVQDGLLYALSTVEDIRPGTRPSIYSFQLFSFLGTGCALEPIGHIFKGLPETTVTQNGVTGLTVVGKQ
jgi:6-phosphogluconolactonase